MKIEVMPSALQDIKEILRFVQKQSVQNAAKLKAEIKEKIASLHHFPERGILVKEISNPQLREVKLYHFRIIYRCLPDKVQVITVHHSARLLLNNLYLKISDSD